MEKLLHENLINNEEASLEEFYLSSSKILLNFDNEIKKIRENIDVGDLSKQEKEIIVKSSNKIRTAIGNFSKFVLLRVLPVYLSYFAIAGVVEKKDGKFSDKENAKTEMLKDGITSEQRSAYRLGVSEFLYRGIIPWGYQNNESVNSIPHLDAIKYFPQRAIFGREIAPNYIFDHVRIAVSLAREDAWRLALGLRQENNTFGISDYFPENSSTDKYYYKINGFETKLFSNHFMDNKKWNKLDDLQKGWIKTDRSTDSQLDSLEFNNLDKKGEPLPLSVLELVSLIKNHGGKIVHSDIEGDMTIGLMGHYTLSCGEDEKGSYVSYYDKWDLDNTLFDLGDVLIKPYEIYDRIYYNPKTGDLIK